MCLFTVLICCLDMTGNCAKAVLNGETAGTLEFTADAVPFIWQSEGSYPTTSRGVVIYPLEWTWTRYHPLEKPDQLVVQMLYDLCTPSSRDDLEVVRLLAPKTVEIEQEFFKYLKEQKVHQFAALLMVAREHVMPGLEERLKIWDFVQKEIADLEIFMFRSTCDVDNDKLILEAQKKKMEMEAILLLLQVFEHIGDKIAAYLRLSPYPGVCVLRLPWYNFRSL